MIDELGYINSRIYCLQEDINIAEKEIEDLNLRKKELEEKQ